MPSTIYQARGRLATAIRLGKDDAAHEARRDLAAAKIAAHITKTLEGAPALSPEQRAHLTALLAGGNR